MILIAEKEEDRERARLLGEQYFLEVFPCLPEGLEEELYLSLSEEGLSLNQGKLKLLEDWGKMLPRLKQSNLEHELLLKAVRLKENKNPRVLDATAGLGEDSLILAAGGCCITLCEYDPVIFLLLSDARDRALKNESLAAVVSRMTLFSGDSLKLMEEQRGSFDVVYLDPMFPGRTKSADVKKKFQLLHGLERPCENEEELLKAALSSKVKKVVVKRPVKGAYLAGLRPDHDFSGKAVRYDVYINPEVHLTKLR